MAAVYLAESAELQENGILKLLRTDRSSEHSTEILERFHAECQIISSVKSLQIVGSYDFGQLGHDAFIAMEFFPCGDLKTRMQNPVRGSEALSYLEQIGEVLEVIHKVSVLHRDLKPANVMLREDNTLALIDVGISKSQFTTTSATITGTILRTPFYASPEQLSTEFADERSNLYSASVILYELLSGKQPYVSNSAMELVEMGLTAPIAKLPERLEHLQPLVDGLLTKSPTERFESAAQVSKLTQTLSAAGIRAATR